MPVISIGAPIKEGALYIRVKRADGSIEDRGLWAYSHRNRFRNWLGNLVVKWNVRRAQRKGWK